MKPRTEDTLMSAVFAEGLPAEFSDQLLAGTLRAVRRRRHYLTVKRGALAAAFAAAMLLALWPRFSDPSQPVNVTVVPSFIVPSRPLPPGSVVTSSAAAMSVIPTRSDSIARIQSAPAEELFEWLDDVALLAFTGSRPAVIVRLGEEPAKLVWLTASTGSLH